MKKLLAISLALILALGMVSIAAAEDVITIGFAQVGHESDWRAANTLDYQNTFTAENGYELLFVDADNDHTAQMEAVRNFIQQEVDYIVICPVQEAGWDVVLQEAQDAGIPVIIADRTVSADPSLYSCFIGTDSKAEGVLAGQWLAETLDGAEANILRCEASLDIARLNLSYTVLTAPYDGYIGRRTLEPGQYVQSGQTISYLVRSKDKWVTANYKETQIAHIFIGQEVIIKVDALPGRRFRGRVTAISEATGSKYSLVPTDNSAGNFVKVQQRIPVRIEFEGVTDEEMALLRAGMMVETEALRR